MAAGRTSTKKPAPKPGGAPVDRYFAEQTPDKRALLEKLRAIVVKTLPDADVAIKWGVPIYQRNGKNVCALASFKDHVAINFFASPSVLPDPQKKLEGGGKTSRMLKVRTAADIDSASITRWLKAAAG
jgi:hypothetical protein